MYKFWSMAVKSAEKRTDLYILDEIASRESWWSDAVTPKAFKRDLDQAEGTLYVWLDSPGGDAFAGSTIHDMLREYSASGRGRVIAMVSLAASAASIIAMAADEIRISVLGTMMIHEPWSQPTGNSTVLRAMADVLDAVRDGQVDAYVRRTGQSRERILEMLKGTDGNGTYMNAEQAIVQGFADRLMHEDDVAEDRRPSALMRSLTEVRIAACIEREDRRVAGLTTEALTTRIRSDRRITANAMRGDAVTAESLGLEPVFASISPEAVVAALDRIEARSDLVDALVCGIRAGLARWDAIQAAAPEEDEDDGSEALRSAIEATNDIDTEEV